MKNFKKLSVTVLTVGLLASTTVSALATENDKVDTSNFEVVNLQDALANVKEKTTTVDDLQTIATNIPAGYLANNLFALSMNMEKISNPKAKAALQKNIDKAVAKWEKKNNVDITPPDKTIKATIVDESEPVTPDISEKTEEIIEKEVVKNTEKHVSKDAKKAESKSAKAIEKQQSKEVHNAVKVERKLAKKAKKEERKKAHAAKKEQHQKHKAHKKEGKGNKHKE